MSRMKQFAVIAFVGVASFSLMTSPVSADQTFEKLSKNHLLFGVSQFLAGNITTRELTPLKLFNPTPVTQVVAALFYQREGGRGGGGNAGEFQACLVPVLTPHGALQLSVDFLVSSRAYVEVISAPATPVRIENKKSKKSKKSNKHRRHKKRGVRLADGLGIRGTATLTQQSSVPLSMVHPELFSLPSDDAVLGQQAKAIGCVCQQLPSGAENVFEDFGISCL